MVIVMTLVVVVGLSAPVPVPAVGPAGSTVPPTTGAPVVAPADEGLRFAAVVIAEVVGVLTATTPCVAAVTTAPSLEPFRLVSTVVVLNVALAITFLTSV